jgi:uncharacterized membrane protein
MVWRLFVLKKRIWLAAAAAVALLLIGTLVPAHALAQGDEEPVVYGVLLYSPQCPHCHDLIQNDWPGIQAEFGDQLRVLFINVLSEGGNALAGTIYEAYGIPPEERYVPMMIIGEHVFVGGDQIPTEGVQTIREGLASGGIPLPDVPGLAEVYEQAVAQAEAEQAAAEATAQPAEEAEAAEPAAGEEAEAAEPAAGEEAETAEPPTGEESNPGPAESEPAETPPAEAPALEPEDINNPPESLGARLALDPLANGLAVVVLLGLMGGVGAVVTGGMSARQDGGAGWLAGRGGWIAAFLTALVGAFVALTLVLHGGAEPLPALLGTLAAGLLAMTTISILLRGRMEPRVDALPGWLIAVVALAGLAAAVYLAFVEANDAQAFCGAVGDCNTVQASRYARLFGVLPIGVMGVVGYALMLAAWLVSAVADGALADWADVALLVMALGGVAFSAYLTFLEPFVIGATCAWCLTSALVMLLLLWLAAPRGWKAVRRLAG